MTRGVFVFSAHFSEVHGLDEKVTFIVEGGAFLCQS